MRVRHSAFSCMHMCICVSVSNVCVCVCVCVCVQSALRTYWQRTFIPSLSLPQPETTLVKLGARVPVIMVIQMGAKLTVKFATYTCIPAATHPVTRTPLPFMCS